MTAKMLHYVRFYFPSVFPGLGFGDFLAPIKDVEIAARSVTEVKKPDDAYAYEFYDVQVAVENGIQMFSDRIITPKKYFYDGQIMPVKKVLETTSDPVLRWQIKNENWKRAVLCNDGEYRNFKRGDCVVMTSKKSKKEV